MFAGYCLNLLRFETTFSDLFSQIIILDFKLFSDAAEIIFLFFFFTAAIFDAEVADLWVDLADMKFFKTNVTFHPLELFILKQ